MAVTCQPRRQGILISRDMPIDLATSLSAASIAASLCSPPARFEVIDQTTDATRRWIPVELSLTHA
eukprot:SAG25_NODE_2585_length_1514_cov_1.236749_1_plen_65_part_10